MADRRRYTGTQTLQLLWSAVALVVVVALQVVASGEAAIPSSLAVVAPVVIWFLGLVALGLRERRGWQRLVADSSFQRLTGPREADLERIVGGHSVRVATHVPGLLSGTHTVISTPVEGVEASFTVRITHHEIADSEGLTTGDDALDDRFAVEGARRNVARLLSTDVREALLEIETPGTCTVTGDRVEYDVPFTRLTPAELETIAVGVATVVTRLEALGAGR
jgi:hypothetical protein